MRVVEFENREGWQERMEALGFAYHSFDGTYWRDEVGLAITQAEWLDIKQACLEAHRIGMGVARRACQSSDFAAWGLPAKAHAIIESSWERKDPSVYGRFDLSFGEDGRAKIYEYNADTPTGIMEASRAQMDWCQARGLRSACQLGQMMPAAFEALARAGATRLAIAGLASAVEDTANLLPMVQWAREAGLDASWRSIESMQYHYGPAKHGFDGEPFDWIFKLYPWEFLFAEAPDMLASTNTRFVEPAWKALLSCKAFLAKAWEAEPGHPHLLPCFLETDPRHAELTAGYVRKPLYSREGANVEVISPEGTLLQKEVGPYGREGWVRQAYCAMPEPVPGMRFTLGGWIAGEEFAGVCARFTDDHVVSNVSWCCPVYIE